MRIVAVGLVIFNHSPGYTLYMISDGSKQKLYMFLTMITKINVPLFLMVSGALYDIPVYLWNFGTKFRGNRIVLVFVFLFGIPFYIAFYEAYC